MPLYSDESTPLRLNAAAAVAKPATGALAAASSSASSATQHAQRSPVSLESVMIAVKTVKKLLDESSAANAVADNLAIDAAAANAVRLLEQYRALPEHVQTAALVGVSDEFARQFVTPAALNALGDVGALCAATLPSLKRLLQQPVASKSSGVPVESVSLVPDAAAIEAVIGVYKRAPKELRVTIRGLVASKLPASAAAVLPMLDELPAPSLARLVHAGAALLIKMKTAQVTGGTSSRGANSSGNHALGAEQDDAAGIPAQEAGALFAEIQALPPRMQKAMLTALPDAETRAIAENVMQIAEGLETEDVVTMIKDFNANQAAEKRSSGHDSAVAAASPSSVSGKGGITEPAAAADDPEAAKYAMMVKFAKKIARAEARRLFKWVRDNPFSLRVLAFLCGLFTLGGAVFGFVVDLVTGHELSVLLNLWLIFFGLLIMVLEAKVVAIETRVLPLIEAYCQFLGTVHGRGCFLLFCGLLEMSLLLAGFWQEIVTFACGALCCLVGIAQMIAGAVAHRRFEAMRERFANEEVARAAFLRADANSNGELDYDELADLCTELGSTLDGGQLRSLLRRLDTNGNGSVSMDEFLAFWCPPVLPSSETATLVASRPQPVVMTSSKSALASAQQPLLGISVVSHSTNSLPSEMSNDTASATSSRRPPSWLRILNVLCGLFLVAGASVGAEIAGRSIIENEQHIADARQLLPLVLNAWLLLFGVMVVLIEVRYPACVGSCFAHVFDHHFRALDTNIGRGVCYVFAGMVGVQLYQPGLGLLQLLTVFAGLGVIVVGIVNMISGHLAMAAQRDLLERLRASLRLNGSSSSAANVDDDGEQKLEHQRAALAAAFRSADADGSGELGLNEVAALVQSLGMNLDHRAWESLVTQLDRDASGSVSFDEFVRWYVTTAS